MSPEAEPLQNRAGAGPGDSALLIKIRELALMEHIQRLARSIMLDRPPGANDYARDLPKLRAALLSGDGVVKVVGPRGEAGYIVIEGGRRRTYDRLPEGIDPDRVVTEELAVEQVLEPELRRLAEEFRHSNELRYDESDVPEILSVIEVYEQFDGTAADAVSVANVLSSAAPGPEHDTDEAVSAWADALNYRITDRFVRLLVPAPTAADIKAACWLISGCRAPAWLYKQALPPFQLPEAVAVPELSADHLIALLDHAGLDGTDTAFRTARGLFKHGDLRRRDADGARDFLQFHRALHHALLSYITALRLARIVVDRTRAGSPPMAQRVEEAQRLYDSAEEMRAIIGTSLMNSALDRPYSRNVTRMDRWAQWLSQLRDTDLEEALDDVGDSYIRLIFPRYMKRIADACVRLDHLADGADSLHQAVRAARSLALAPGDDLDLARVVAAPQAASLVARVAAAYLDSDDTEKAGPWVAMYSLIRDRWPDDIPWSHYGPTTVTD